MVTLGYFVDCLIAIHKGISQLIVLILFCLTLIHAHGLAQQIEDHSHYTGSLYYMMCRPSKITISVLVQIFETFHCERSYSCIPSS